MGTCIICGTSVDGEVCSSHEEDVAFEFRGTKPEQLTPGRFYRGTVDGYAEFGVFVDVGERVTGLLHRSEIDRRLESLEWEPGDEVFVQVTGVRDNGNVDLAWSTRQSANEFRASLIDTPSGDRRLDGDDSATDGTDDSTAESGATSSGESGTGDSSVIRVDTGGPSGTAGATGSAETTGGVATTGSDDEAGSSASVEATTPSPSGSETGSQSASETTSTSVPTGESAGTTTDVESAERDAGADVRSLERTTVDALADQVGAVVRLDGEIIGVRQTSGPTVFELRDETGTVECAAFESAGVRAYPAVEVGDAVALVGEVERHHGDLQVETESLEILTDEAAGAVHDRLEAAIDEEAQPPTVEPLAEYEPVAAVADELVAAATAIRRAVMAGRPVILRHRATADGYVAGAALERAILPLVADEHARDDAVYHYVERRPLDGTIYDVDAATGDLTSLLEARERHGESLPLVVLVGVGSTVESVDAIELLSIYDVDALIVDATRGDDAVLEAVETAVNPSLSGGSVSALTTTALAASVAARVNPDVREDLQHLPAMSYWDDTPAVYRDLAATAGFEDTTLEQRRRAVAFEAHFQTYNDKRQLVSDLLFDPDVELADHVAGQFDAAVDREVETALANVERFERDAGTVALLDVDAYSHRYDFPPIHLLLDEVHRRLRADLEGDLVTVGLEEAAVRVRSTASLDVRTMASALEESLPDAAVRAVGGHDGRIEFLVGERSAVREALVDVTFERLA